MHGQWRGPAGRPPVRSALSARPGPWRAQAGRLASRTCTLGTLLSSMCSDGAQWVDQPAARQLAPGLGRGRHRPVVWPVNLHARHSVERYGRWQGLAGRPASPTSTLGTLPPGLGSGGVWPVTSQALGIRDPAWGVVGTGRSSGRLDLQAQHSVEEHGWWRCPVGHPAGRTSTFGTLPPGPCGG